MGDVVEVLEWLYNRTNDNSTVLYIMLWNEQRDGTVVAMHFSFEDHARVTLKQSSTA